MAQLSRGTSPTRLAATLAVGTTCSVFPFLGATMLVNLAAGWALRLNQPLLQVLNQILGPLQLLLILVYVRAGEWIWRSEAHRFSISDVVTTFRQASFAEFLTEFGWAGVHAFTAWLASAPLLTGVVFLLVRPLLLRLARSRRAADASAVTPRP